MPVVYFLLYLWLDATVPTSLGVKRSCCFCCPCKKKNEGNDLDDEMVLLDDN